MMALLKPDLPLTLFSKRVRFGLAVRLSLALAGAVGLVFIIAFYYDYQESRRHALASVKETIAGLSSAVIGNLESILADVTDVADDLVNTVALGIDDAQLRKEVEDAILDSSDSSGVTIPDGRLFLGIGDVAGKGIPAALMMAVTATLIKGMAVATPDPADLLGRVNSELCAMSKELLFVTLFAAVLNPATGELVFSNAGHNPPLIRRADGRAQFMTVTPGLALGVEAEWRYVPAREQLAPGDILLLYTDGVTEAMNIAFECFEPHRLLEVSRAADIASPHQWVKRVVSTVALHVGTAEQSDDLTLLAVVRPLSMIEPTVESLAHDH